MGRVHAFHVRGPGFKPLASLDGGTQLGCLSQSLGLIYPTPFVNQVLLHRVTCPWGTHGPGVVTVATQEPTAFT